MNFFVIYFKFSGTLRRVFKGLYYGNIEFLSKELN